MNACHTSYSFPPQLRGNKAAITVAIKSAVPSQSIFGLLIIGLDSFFILTQRTKIVGAPNGKLIKKIHLHPALSVIAPPINGPMTLDTANVMAITEAYFPLSLGVVTSACK